MSGHETNLKQLRGMPSLAEVGDDAMRWLAAHVNEVPFEAGCEFITEDDTSRDCYFIVSGETQVCRREVPLGITGPGEPEGEVALFLGIPRTATTTAITDVVALRLSASDYDALRANAKDLADDLRVNVCRHLARRFGLPSFAGVHA